MASPTTRRAFFYATVVTLGGFIFGLDAAVISGTVRFITAEWDLNEWQVGTVVSAPGLGVLFALLLAGYFADRFGRKKALLLVAALYVASAVTSAVAPSFEGLVAARFLGGFAFTSLSLASMYIGEIAPPHLRGKLVSMNQINIVVGLSGAYFVNYLILMASNSGASWAASLGMDQFAWRWMLGSEIVPAALWLGMLAFIPESPRWLMLNGRQEEAANVMARILPPDEMRREIAEIRESIQHAEEGPTFSAQLRALLSPRMRMIAVIGFTIAVVQPITGINAILFYAPTVFEQVGLGTDAAFKQAVWVGLASVAFTALSMLLIDRLGRRPMMIWGLTWTIASLATCVYGFKTARYTLSQESLASLIDEVDTSALEPLVGVEHNSDIAFKRAIQQALGESAAKRHESRLIQEAGQLNVSLILVGIMSFICAFNFSVGPIMWVLFSEIFPISVRGVAIPCFAFVTSILSYLVQKFFPWQLATMGAAEIFLTYAVMSSLGLVALVRYLPETKNKTIEEIEADFQIS